MDSKYNSIVILGQTATGKTSIGAAVAKRLSGEVISADSRQVYKELNIGSGKDLNEYFVDGVKVPYHLIDIVSLSTEYSVFQYQKDFFTLLPSLLNRHTLPIVVGGTGMYLDAIVRGYNLYNYEGGSSYDRKLEEVLSPLTKEKLSALYLLLRPNLHTLKDLEDRERLTSGIKIEAMKKNIAPALLPHLTCESVKMLPAYKTIKENALFHPYIYGIECKKEELWKRIEARLKARIKEGMIKEVEGILKSGVSKERLYSLGLEYKYCCLYLEGKIKNIEELTSTLYIKIRQFAKRQATWFRFMQKNGCLIHWLSGEKEDIIEEICSVSRKIVN